MFGQRAELSGARLLSSLRSCAARAAHGGGDRRACASHRLGVDLQVPDSQLCHPSLLSPGVETLQISCCLVLTFVFVFLSSFIASVLLLVLRRLRLLQCRLAALRERGCEARLVAGAAKSFTLRLLLRLLQP